MKNAVTQVKRSLEKHTLEKHCKEFDLDYKEAWTITKMEHEIRNMQLNYERDAMFIFNFKRKVKERQFEGMGLFYDNSPIDGEIIYIEDVKYPLSCKWSIFKHQHKWTLIISLIVLLVLFLIGLRLRYAIECFKQGFKGFEHIRNVYLKEGTGEVALSDAIEKLYAEGIITIYNVHVRNVIYDLIEASKSPKIRWRQVNKHGDVQMMISI